MTTSPYSKNASFISLTFKNPILKDGQDPWIVYYNNYYYFVQSKPNKIVIKKISTIAQLENAPEVFVWTAPESGNQSKEIWAPELHRINDKWYIYYAASNGNNSTHRMYVLEGTSDDPQGNYIDRGKIFDPLADKWAIDGTVLQFQNQLYFIWSGWPSNVGDFPQNLYIAPMSNPWKLSANRILLSEPSYSWEKLGASINEGPQVLQRNGKLFIIYSADASWKPTYKLGQLTYNGGNILDASSWVKHPESVFEKGETEIYGPGHASFFKSPDGLEDWIMYHAKKNAGDNWEREIRTQKFTWRDDGSPNFGSPVSNNISLPLPSSNKF